MRILLPVGITASALVASHAFVAPSSRSARHQFALSATDIKGTVKWYNPERGFGFIEVDEGGPDMYVHATGLLFDGPLIEEERVSFITEIDRRTNKPKAVEVERIAAEEAVVEEAEPEPVEEAPVEEAPVEEEPAKTVVATILAGPVKQKLPVATPPDETFQRSLLEAQIANKAPTQAASPFQSVDYDSAARLAYEAAGESGDFEAFKAKYVEDASAMVGDKYKAAAEADAAEAKAKAEAAEAARLAKEAEEKRLAEEAAAAEAKAKAEAEAAEAARLAEEAAAAKAKAEAEAAEAARLAEEKRLAEEAAAAEALEAEARELGYPSVAVMKARQQPKSAEEEAALASKYGAMDLEERAFSILTDLGMIDLNPDPEDPNRDTSKDDDDME
jgi:cold shock CspA family protein